ncbi:MAG: hypothetical protein WB443_13745, partial [Nitrososphaeraceae archaeon]
MRLKARLQGQCEYGKGEKRVEYYDYKNQRSIPYECPRNSLPDRHYCKFHDSDYAQTNPDDVMKSFYTLVDEAVQNTKSLFCIGFYLPREVKLANMDFKGRIYFSSATFTKEAYFSDTTFNDKAF